ncbi:RICIN domain-containing protein [Kitasatospora aureofaciens]|uniref:RICIN domain-containing protein n=1 Tax=Kitasatospora aureofaciens TaxID=1894 RepID=UPI001C46271E|nr:RICIN domain-containing protein [Kitasatospora aureofaciens]MBV6701912.1 RICIN domain-containing protein [Kitasatospora aureofaciens]
MTIGRKAASLAAVASALAGMALFAAPAHASTAITKSVQNYADNTNLDAYYGQQVWTRDSSMNFQVWTFTQVGTTFTGVGIYTISSTTYGTCLQDVGVGSAVKQQTCDGTNLAQRWVVDFGQPATTIASAKNPAEVLQGNGSDTAVTLVPAASTANQVWTLYDK